MCSDVCSCALRKERYQEELKAVQGKSSAQERTCSVFQKQIHRNLFFFLIKNRPKRVNMAVTLQVHGKKTS
jgi:hypothetical protein